jgi:hypothetical protein
MGQKARMKARGKRFAALAGPVNLHVMAGKNIFGRSVTAVLGRLFP